MRFRSMWISGAIVLILLVSGHAPAQNVAPGAGAPTRSVDSATQQRLSEAKAAENSGDFTKSGRLWTQLAEQGMPEAETHLGMMYHDGEFGMCRDKAAAVEWLQKAANQRFAEAYRRLAEAYASDSGSGYDPSVAQALYQKGADLGDADSQSELFEIFWNGKGVPKDPAKAVYWLEKAASQAGPGRILDAYSLGAVYSNGKDIPQNDEKAIYWYLKAANGGLSDAQFELAGLYEKTRDYVEAYKWYALVAASDAKKADERAPANYKEDVRARDRVAAQMTPAQIAKAETLVAKSHITPLYIPPPQVMPVNAGCS